MKLGRLFSVAALAAASLLLIGTESRAATVPLPATLDVVNGNQAVVGDTTFNFLEATPTGTPPRPLSGIQVVPQTPGLGGATFPPFGIGFTGVIVAAASGGTSDLFLNYTVASSNGPITAVNLTGVGGAIGDGSFVGITEGVYNPLTGATIGSGTLPGSGSLTIPLSESLTSIGIREDILAVAGPGADASANFSFAGLASQTFTQVIPEPASIVMMGTGLLGVIGFGVARGRKLNQTV